MTARSDDVGPKLDAIQSKLELMHADIKKITSSGGNILLGAPRLNGQRGMNGVDIPSLSPPPSGVVPRPIGRGNRIHPTIEICTDTPAPIASMPSPSFLPAIARVTGPTDAESSDVSIIGANSLSVRRKADAAKQKREEFVQPMRLDASVDKIESLRGAPCTWLLCAALTCSYVSGENIGIEDVLRLNRLGLHYVSFPSVTLAELFDVINEFLSDHKKMIQQNIHCEVATFDTETVDEVGEGIGMGERLPIMTLSQFRKELTTNNSDPHMMYIVNYDPYVIEQYEIGMRMNSMECSQADPYTSAKPRWSQNNQGTFGLILNFSSALHSVSVGTPYLLESGRVGIREQTVPVQTLYKALCVKDRYCNRSRGFVRVFVDVEFSEQAPSIFPLKVIDGSASGGLLTTALDTSIASHILGLSLMHHLVNATLLDRAAQRRQSCDAISDKNLRGIPVTKLCQQLRLDVMTIVRPSNKASVPSAFSWYRSFLRRLGIENAIALGVVLPARRGGAEDAPVNVSDDTFMSHIELAVDSKSVMLIGFDVNVALNVKVDIRPEPCHFAIVIGFDQDRGIVRLADVNVKKYRKSWHVPITRLYTAVIGYGYIMAAKSQSVVDKLNAREFEQAVLCEARFAIPPFNQQPRFEYPVRNYVVTVLADAFSHFGFNADVKSVINSSGFHLSFMLSEHLPLENAVTVARNYSHIRHNDAVSVASTHMDKGGGYTSLTLIKQIRSALQSPKTQRLIVNFQTSIIQAKKEVWNGSNGGSYAIVVDYDENSSLVTLSDANHVTFYRTWVCPLEALFDAVCAMDPIALRAGGTLLLTHSSQEDFYKDCYGYDMCHSLVHHPFKPSFSPTFHCLALVASHMSALFHEGSDSARPVQFSAEDFLYAMPSFSVHKFLTGEFKSEHIAALANTAFERLQIPLDAAVVDVGAAGSFLEACREEMQGDQPVTMTLVGYETHAVHGVPGFSVGVINRVRSGEAGGMLQVVDGNSCTYGSVWERTVPELQGAITALVRIERR